LTWADTFLETDILQSQGRQNRRRHRPASPSTGPWAEMEGGDVPVRKCCPAPSGAFVLSSHASHHSCLAPQQALQLLLLWAKGAQGNCTLIENTYFLPQCNSNQ